MWLIKILEDVFGKLVFRIGKHEFQGFRPFSYMDLPWKNNTEMNEYMNGLEKENTPYSYKKFIYWDEQNHCQKMHTFLSRALFCLITGIALLIISIMLLIEGKETGSIISIAVSIMLIIQNKYLKYRVQKYYTSLEMSQEIFKSSETWFTSDEQE